MSWKYLERLQFLQCNDHQTVTHTDSFVLLLARLNLGLPEKL